MPSIPICCRHGMITHSMLADSDEVDGSDEVVLVSDTLCDMLARWSVMAVKDAWAVRRMKTYSCCLSTRFRHRLTERWRRRKSDGWYCLY